MFPERAQLVDGDMVEEYLATLFGRVYYKPGQFINVRGIGEKGTDRDGTFQEDCWAQPAVVTEFGDPDEALAHDVRNWATVWAQHNVATYIVPAVLKEARGSADNVAMFTALVVDLDTGNTREKFEHLGKHIGQPSMVVMSGGTTEESMPKLHLYWILEEPTSEIGRVVDVRHMIAQKVGGDLQFGRGVDSNPYGRAHQPIRIPDPYMRKAITRSWCGWSMGRARCTTSPCCVKRFGGCRKRNGPSSRRQSRKRRATGFCSGRPCTVAAG
jgi:hypothetical protein